MRVSIDARTVALTRTGADFLVIVYTGGDFVDQDGSSWAVDSYLLSGTDLSAVLLWLRGNLPTDPAGPSGAPIDMSAHRGSGCLSAGYLRQIRASPPPKRDGLSGVGHATSPPEQRHEKSCGQRRNGGTGGDDGDDEPGSVAEVQVSGTWLGRIDVEV